MVQSKDIDTFCRFIRVSRETIASLKYYENHLKTASKSLNLVGKTTINDVWIRHFLDSAQVIDFIDKNDNSLVDIGSGAGFPGIVLAIILKERKNKIKIRLIEKSKKKINFIKEIINKLKLDVTAVNQNVFEQKQKILDDVIVARAFKPLEIILELIHKKASNWKKTFLFLGKTGNEQLLQASKNWDFKYKQRMSITSSDSKIIEIYKLIKK
jgi:16S rRNA (guanine527-N7)-methyltransferase